MSFVRIEQRNARLAANVKLDQVRGSEGLISKGTVVVISNGHRGQGREDEVTSIQWTLWGKQAENAAQYLGKGSHVNVSGRLRNNHYQDATGNTIFGFAFTCEEIDYLDSRAESEARRASEQGPAVNAPVPRKATGKSRKGRKEVAAVDDDVPF